MDYFDENADSDDYVQLADVPNCYFFCIEAHHGKEGENGRVGDDRVQPPKNDDNDGNVNSIAYLTNKIPWEIYDHKMYMVYRLYKRKPLPIHVVLLLVDYIKDCLPRHASLRATKDHVECMGSDIMELFKGTCLSTICNAPLRIDNSESVADIIARSIHVLGVDEDADGNVDADENDDAATTIPINLHSIRRRSCTILQHSRRDGGSPTARS